MPARAVELTAVRVSADQHPPIAEIEQVRLTTLIEIMRDAVLVVDRSGRTVAANEAFVRTFGADLTPQPEAAGPDPADDLRARAAAGEEFVRRFFVTGPDGRRRWYEAYGRPVPPEMGIAGGGILVVRDTTDISLRRLQEEFVGIVAHELRTPLTALHGYLQLLQRRPSRDRDILERAVQQADRLQRMVEELFDVTRVERGRLSITPTPVAIGEVIDQAVDIARRVDGGDRRILVEKEDEDVVLDADGGRIQQVLLNLLLNAFVHAPQSPEIHVRLRKRGRRVEIDVEDRGPGIAPELQASLFSAFEQGSRAAGRFGLGLGLYIAREIVVAHGGTIEVDSAPGAGTTFTVRLPVEASAGVEPDSRRTADGAAGPGTRDPEGRPADGRKAR